MKGWWKHERQQRGQFSDVICIDTVIHIKCSHLEIPYCIVQTLDQTTIKFWTFFVKLGQDRQVACDTNQDVLVYSPLWLQNQQNTLITLLRVPIIRPNRQYKASTAEMASVRYS